MVYKKMKFREYIKVQENVNVVEDEIKEDLTTIFCETLNEDDVKEKLMIFFHDDSIIIDYDGVVSSKVIAYIVEYFGQEVTISSRVKISGFRSHVQNKGLTIAVTGRGS